MNAVIGVDEAGRGCWAGPLVAAAVLLHRPVSGVADSKVLTKHRREQLFSLIQASATVGVGWVRAEEIDRIGLTQATRQAMKQALTQISGKYDSIIIDGNINYLPEYDNVSVLPKADSLISVVSAASIIAKVSRDRYIHQMAAHYPAYQFERHVGYGTALHRQNLKLHGPCKLHRLSYKPLRALLGAADV